MPEQLCVSPAAPAYEDVLAGQRGVISRRQALAGGMSPEAWEWRLRRTWQAPTPGVAVSHRGPLSAGQLLWVAALAAGPGACVTGAWALAEQGAQIRRPDVVDVLVPSARRVVPRTLQPVRLRLRPHRLASLDAARHPARPHIARPAAAALHAAAWAPSDRGAETYVAAVVQRRLTTPAAVRAALQATPRLSRRRLISLVLDDVELGAHARTELDLLAFLRRHRLPKPDQLQLRERGTRLRYLDAWWERQRVVVEVDGAHHRLVGQWEDDLLRANEVHVDHRHDRVLLLRLTSGHLRHDGPEVARQLRAVLVTA